MRFVFLERLQQRSCYQNRCQKFRTSASPNVARSSVRWQSIHAETLKRIARNAKAQNPSMATFHVGVNKLGSDEEFFFSCLGASVAGNGSIVNAINSYLFGTVGLPTGHGFDIRRSPMNCDLTETGDLSIFGEANLTMARPLNSTEK